MKIKKIAFLVSEITSEMLKGIINGPSKKHRQASKNLYQFHPSYAAYNSPSFKISKYLTKIFALYTTNERTVENYQQFALSVTSVSSANTSYMVSVDVDNIFHY